MPFNLEDLLKRNPQLRRLGDDTQPAKTAKSKVERPAKSAAADSKRVRREAGKAARKSGESWETQTLKECALARRMGWAVVDKHDPPTRVMRGKGGGLVVRYTKKGGADWTGIAFGYGVAFETKSVSQKNTYTILSKNEQQLGYLIDYHSCAEAIGKYALVGYYVFWSSHNEKRFHPISSISGRTIKRIDGILVDHWIDAIERETGIDHKGECGDSAKKNLPLHNRFQAAT